MILIKYLLGLTNTNNDGRYGHSSDAKTQTRWEMFSCLGMPWKRNPQNRMTGYRTEHCH